MDLQAYLDQRNISKYRLAQMSGVPKTTIMDICSGRSEIERCSAKTVLQLAKALDCTMEEVMEFESPSAVPEDRLEKMHYLECGLPEFLQESVRAMKTAWGKLDRGEEYLRWDCDYCNLQSDINIAETSQTISEEQAWHLRTKYLRMERV